MSSSQGFLASGTLLTFLYSGIFLIYANNHRSCRQFKIIIAYEHIDLENVISMAEITIIGAGSFGTALANVLCEYHTITMFDTDKNIVSEINTNYTNNTYLKDIKLASTVSASSTMKATIEKADIIIIAVPSHAIGIVTKQLKTNMKRSIPIISATKGLTAGGKVMTETLERNLPIPSRYVFALSGPSIASELAKGKMTELVLGGDKRIARSLKRELSTPTLALRITSDKIGIQLLGFYKNIIAIMVGICEGLELGTNTTSALVTKAYRELYRRNLMRIRRHTFIDYSGLGDLLVTLYSPQSRNHRFGIRIGQGTTTKKAKQIIGQSIEGLNAIDILSHLEDTVHFDMQLIRTLQTILKLKRKELKKEVLLTYLKM